MCFLIDPNSPLLPYWLSLDHPLTPDPITHEGLELLSTNQAPTTGGTGRINFPEAVTS